MISIRVDDSNPRDSRSSWTIHRVEPVRFIGAIRDQSYRITRALIGCHGNVSLWGHQHPRMKMTALENEQATCSLLETGVN